MPRRQEIDGKPDRNDSEVCPHCGQSLKSGAGLEQFLGRLGITEEMINNLKGPFENVEIDEYLQNARDSLNGRAKSHRVSSPRRRILFPTEEGMLDGQLIDHAITQAVTKK